MYRKLTVIVVLLMLSVSVWATSTPFAAGFGLSNAADNFGINVELSSPSFLRDFLTVRAETAIDFLSAYRDNPDIAWEMFYSERLGVAATGGWAGDAIRLYGEFGGLLVLPPSALSDDSAQAGIYGLFGFEFFISPDEHNNVSYYLEAGSNSLFANAEKLAGKPDYYSGFTVKTGWRYYFR